MVQVRSSMVALAGAAVALGLCGAPAAAREAWSCSINGRTGVPLTFAADICRFDRFDGIARDRECRISNPQLRILVLDPASGALRYEDTDDDRVIEGHCARP